MDALNAIAIAMTAMFFSWVGYFLGIFFPAFGKSKRLKDARKASGEKLINFKALGTKAKSTTEKVDLSFIRRGWKKAVDWLLEREEDASEETTEEEAVIIPDEQPLPPNEKKPEAEPTLPEAGILSNLNVPEGLSVPEDALLLWHDRPNKKLFARVGKEVIDLDTDLSKQQHGALSMLLVDLQDRVGLSATLKAALTEGTEQAYAESERKNKIASLPTEEPVKGASFNPVKSFLDYVKADVPKLEDKPDSIPTQINAILQDLIEGTPLKEQGISVTDWPNRGVVFIVGIDVFESIDEIPDPDIQQAIRTAVEKWEKTQAEED
jgi:hypothetical protein